MSIGLPVDYLRLDHAYETYRNCRNERLYEPADRAEDERRLGKQPEVEAFPEMEKTSRRACCHPLHDLPHLARLRRTQVHVAQEYYHQHKAGGREKRDQRRHARGRPGLD